MFNWRFRFLDKVADDEALPRKIRQIYLDGFGKQDGWSLGSIERTLNRCDALGVLVDPSDELYGYAFYSCPRKQVGGEWLLWEEAVCLKKSVQGHGLSIAALAQVRALYSERTFGWIGGRTQNPLVMKRYARFGPVFPFDSLYSEGEGPVLMRFLQENIAEARDVPQLDTKTGVCAGVYKSGRLGDYAVGIAGSDKFEKQLREWGFRRLNGDAVLVVAQIPEEV